MTFTTLSVNTLTQHGQDLQYFPHPWNQGTDSVAANVPKLCGALGIVLDKTYFYISGNDALVLRSGFIALGEDGSYD